MNRVHRVPRNEDRLIEEVIHYFNVGMWDEWDTGFADGLKIGFGSEELRIAAKSALGKAIYDVEVTL